MGRLAHGLLASGVDMLPESTESRRNGEAGWVSHPCRAENCAMIALPEAVDSAPNGSNGLPDRLRGRNQGLRERSRAAERLP
jgi:hypothetical protein